MSDTATPTAARKRSPRKKVEAAAPAEAIAAEASATDAAEKLKGRFSKAIEEAKAGAEALRGEALEKTSAYMEKGSAYRAKVTETASEWAEEAKVYADQAKVRGAALAVEGKARASDALTTLGKTISDTAGTIDEKLGVQYGDYARSAARTIQESAAKLEAKELAELGEDAKEFVRKSPGLALGIAAVAGFLVSRLFKGGSNEA